MPGMYARSDEMMMGDKDAGGMSSLPPPTTFRQEPAKSSAIAKTTLDLRGNSGQFLQLFSQYLPEGKVKFVGINFDPATQFSRKQMIDKLTTSAWPWANCLLSDKFNAAQWKMHGVAGAVMLLVDTKGKVRYVGPVGGYLPKMLIEAELKKARAEAPLPVVAANMLKGVDLSKLNAMASAKSPAGAFSLDPNDSSFSVADDSEDEKDQQDDNAPADNESKTETPGADAQSSGSKSAAGGTSGAGSSPSGGSASATSSPQAKQILRTAQLQKRVSPQKALEMCDNVLERWPNSKEADEAKAMIKSILRTPRGKPYIDLRTQQGKFVGDEG